MKRITTTIATVTVMLNIAAAGLYAQERPVSGRAFGIAVPSAVTLKPGGFNSEYNFAGTSPLGTFVFRTLSASMPAGTSSSCPGGVGTAVIGSGVFHFEDGSLLTVNLKEGSDCIVLVPQPEAHCIRTFDITGGTGRFASASGTVTFTETLVRVATSTPYIPAFSAITADLSGSISGVAMQDGPPDGRQ